MAKKKKRSQGAANPARIVKDQVVQGWDDYFGNGELEDWQRLMSDLGFDAYFGSKTQCRKALRGVWVNIRDFLDAIEEGNPPRRFGSLKALASYTLKTQRTYPRAWIPKGSPLSALLAPIL